MGVSFMRVLTSFIRALPPRPNRLPKAPPHNVIVLGVSLYTNEFWRKYILSIAITFSNRLFSFSMIAMRPIQGVECIHSSPLTAEECPMVCMDHCVFSHLSKDIWVVSSFSLSWMRVLWTCRYGFCANIPIWLFPLVFRRENKNITPYREIPIKRLIPDLPFTSSSSPFPQLDSVPQIPFIERLL